MKELLRQIVAGFLILCLVAPFGHFHSHEGEEGHCHETEAFVLSDACCVHNLDGQIDACHCEHEYHIKAIGDDCTLCDYIETQRHEDVISDDSYELSVALSQDFPSLEPLAVIQSVSNTSLGRAPPVC